MKKRRTKPALPRLSVLSMSQREMLRFLDAMEKASFVCVELMRLLPRLEAVVAQLESRTRRRKPAAAEPQEGQGS